MSRLILFVILILAVVVAASAVASVFRQSPKPATPTGAPSGAIPKVAFGLLMVVLLGVGSGWLGAD